MRIIKIMAGMTAEYELIRTDAPNELIEKQLQRNADGMEVDPYDLLEAESYTVEIIGSSEETMEDIEPDIVFDYYDYME